LLAQLADVCRRWPTRAKWLIVPRHPAGLALTDRLARQAGGWANLRVVTPLDLAIRMAAPHLLERGITPSEESLGPALVMRLLRDVDARPGYFHEFVDQPSLAAALWRAIRELRFAGLTSASLPASAFASSAKHAELVGLLAAYERWLDARRVADMAAVYTHAASGAPYCPIGPSDLRLEWPHGTWDPVVRAFLDALPGERMAGRAVTIPGRPAAGSVRGGSFGALVEPVDTSASRAAERLRFLLAPTSVPSAPPPDRSLEFFHAGGRHAEIDEVARRVLGLGRPLDQVEIACATDDHVWLAWETCVRLGWRATVSAGLPVLSTAPGRALTGWCGWIDERFSGAAMRRLLLSGAVAPRAWVGEDGRNGLSPTRAARLLAEAAPSWGRDTWTASLAAFAAHEEQRAQEGEAAETSTRDWRLARARDARAVAAWVVGLLDAMPDGTPPLGSTLGEVIAAARSFLADNVAVRNPVDALARSALLQMLDTFAPVADQPWPVADALRLVSAEAAALRVGMDRARPGHLHISTLDVAGEAGRPHAFIVGLEEGRVFPGAREDPILLDRERDEINRVLRQPGLLRNSVGRQREAIDGRLARLATIGVDAEHVTLSYSCRDAREFRETFASWVVLNAFRLARGDASLSYRRLHEALGEVPASSVPATVSEATTTAQWWLGHARRARDARAAILAAYPYLERGLAAVAARASDDFTIFDGLVEEAAALDPSRAGRLTSVSMLERLAGCPFRFFLERGLGVTALEEGEPDVDAWLDGRTRGSELHALYASLMRRARDLGRRVTVTADLAWARHEAETALERLRVAMPPPSDTVFARESEEFLEDVELFVREEASNTTVEPVGFEVEFGPGASPGEPLNDDRPLDLTLAPTRVLQVRGRIDRIDRLADGTTYQIVDYKTGRYFKKDFEGVFVKGTRLQPMVYGLAAEQSLARTHRGARVVHGAYVFPTGRGFRTVKEVPLPPARDTHRVIALALDVVGTGTFPTTVEDDGCRFCELGRACGHAPDERTNRKLDAAVLSAFRRLREVE
jgi:ATP-dependent helicase/nuclease subunit B